MLDMHDEVTSRMQDDPVIRRPRRTVKRVAIAFSILVAFLTAADFGYRYLTVGRYLEVTDDAYVKADYTTVAPKVSGHIAEVLVADNEQVTVGQTLARIDERDLATARDRAHADVSAAAAAIRNIESQIDLQRAVIDQHRAEITGARAALEFATADHDRYQNLRKTGYGSVQRAQQAASTLHQKSAGLHGARAALIAAQKKVEVLATERVKMVAQHERSIAIARQADLNLSYAVVTAPINGTVGARSLRVGQFVTAGTPLMAVVPLSAVYVVANFKETQLASVRPGQPVRIAVDGLPDVTLRGRVDSVSPASGLEFALLPPDNATGNFTKIVQRVPVRITIDPDDLTGLLRAGMSAVPTIDTRAVATTKGPPTGPLLSELASLISTRLGAN